MLETAVLNLSARKVLMSLMTLLYSLKEQETDEPFPSITPQGVIFVPKSWAGQIAPTEFSYVVLWKMCHIILRHHNRVAPLIDQEAGQMAANIMAMVLATHIAEAINRDTVPVPQWAREAMQWARKLTGLDLDQAELGDVYDAIVNKKKAGQAGQSSQSGRSSQSSQSGQSGQSSQSGRSGQSGQSSQSSQPSQPGQGNESSDRGGGNGDPSDLNDPEKVLSHSSLKSNDVDDTGRPVDIREGDNKELPGIGGAAQEVSRAIGKQPGDLQSACKLNDNPAGLIDPRELLRATLTNLLSELLPGLRYHPWQQTLWKPPPCGDTTLISLRRVSPYITILLSIDTSGSMGAYLGNAKEDQLKTPIGRAMAVVSDVLLELAEAKIFLAWGDTTLSGLRQVQAGDEVTIKGGGGTDMGVLIKQSVEGLLDKEGLVPSVAVCITDCDTYWPADSPVDVPVVIVRVGDGPCPSWAHGSITVDLR